MLNQIYVTFFLFQAASNFTEGKQFLKVVLFNVRHTIYRQKVIIKIILEEKLNSIYSLFVLPLHQTMEIRIDVHMVQVGVDYCSTCFRLLLCFLLFSFSFFLPFLLPGHI